MNIYSYIKRTGRLLKNERKVEEAFLRKPNVIVNTEESSVEIISYETV